MAFNKFEPHRTDEEEPEGRTPSAARRVRILRIAWWVTVAYTAVGFLFLALFWRYGNPF